MAGNDYVSQEEAIELLNTGIARIAETGYVEFDLPGGFLSIRAEHGYELEFIYAKESDERNDRTASPPVAS